MVTLSWARSLRAGEQPTRPRGQDRSAMTGVLRAVLPTAARLLRLLTLLSSRRTWAGPDLAERLEVTDRTLRRDVDRLRSLGYPVQSTAGSQEPIPIGRTEPAGRAA